MNKRNAFLVLIVLPCIFFFGGNYMYVNYPEITKVGFFIFLGFTFITICCAVWHLMALTAVATVETHKMINDSLVSDTKD